MAEPTKTKRPKATPETGMEYVVARLTEPSTWAGILTIGAMFATGDLSSWLNPVTLPTLIAGVGLILSKDQK